MPKLQDKTGQQFEMLTVIRRSVNGKDGQPRWEYECDKGMRTSRNHYNGYLDMNEMGLLAHTSKDAGSLLKRNILYYRLTFFTAVYT